MFEREESGRKRCPACKMATLRRSQMRGMLERGVLRPVGIRAYRCDVCDQRFLRFGGAHKEQSAATVLSGKAR